MTTLFGYDTEKSWDYENGFYITSPITRLAKLCAHLELYTQIAELPGHVVELGVLKGASLIRFATFRNLYESEHSRKIIGFDAFGKFPQQQDEHDKEFIERFESSAGQGISKEELESIFQLKGIGNIELIEGDILTTLPDYLHAHPELKISLLHIDVDVYEPTKFALQHLYERVVPNGIIVLDDYGTVAGETKAVDEFFKDKDIDILKPSISHIPSYIVKK